MPTPVPRLRVRGASPAPHSHSRSRGTVSPAPPYSRALPAAPPLRPASASRSRGGGGGGGVVLDDDATRLEDIAEIHAMLRRARADLREERAKNAALRSRPCLRCDQVTRDCRAEATAQLAASAAEIASLRRSREEQRAALGAARREGEEKKHSKRC